MAAHTMTTCKVRPTGINGLFRVDLEVGESFWCGAIRFDRGGRALDVTRQLSGIAVGSLINRPAPTFRSLVTSKPDFETADNNSLSDGLFYIREVSSGENEIVVSKLSLSRAADLQHYFQPYRFVDGSNNQKNFYGVIVNGYDHPFIVGRDQDNDGKTIPVFSFFIPNNAGIEDLSAGDPTAPGAVDLGASSIATFAITAIRHITIYQGSLVYGGYRSWNPKTATPVLQNFHNWVAFSGPIGGVVNNEDFSHGIYSAYEVAANATLQIGETAGEPITQVEVNSTDTDALGIKGQLCIFTPNKVVFFDGIPPIPGNPLDVTFRSVGAAPFGTWASRSVVRTPYGLVYLGTDGMVRLIPHSGHPVDIGRAIEPSLRELGAIQQIMACGVYHRGYYLLSVPDKNGAHNAVQWWGDLRQLGQPGKTDAGVDWYGPQVGQYVSCFAVGRGQGDNQQVMAGSAVSSHIMEVFREDKNSDPRMPWQPDTLEGQASFEIPIIVDAESNPIDMGDAHVDKVIDSISVGFSTDDVVNMKIAVSAESVDMANGTIESLYREFDEVVQPTTGGVKGTTFQTRPRNAFELVTKYLPNTLRGRAVTAAFQETPNATANKDAKVGISDIKITFTPMES